MNAEQIRIPTSIVDLDAYREWAHSDAYPQTGSLSYLDDEIWVDLTGEELFTHNQVKLAYLVSVIGVLEADPRGSFAANGMFLTIPNANLATEPDGIFYLWSTMKEGRLRMVPRKQGGFWELEGTPDMILE